MLHTPATEVPPKTKNFLRALAHGNDPAPEDDISTEKPILTFNDYSISFKEMAELQDKCNKCKNIRKKLELKTLRVVKLFTIENNVIYFKSQTTKRVVLPTPLDLEFLQYLHTLYGHPGTFQLMKLATKYVYIIELKAKSNTICVRCIECLKNKTHKTLRPSLIEKRQFESVPYNKVSIDLYDMGICDSAGKRYLVSSCDHLTGYLDGIPISNKTDRLVSQAILDLILRHGITGVVITDNGSEFGPLTQAIFDRFHIRHVRTAAYMSRSNGRVERCHREITSKLKLMNSDRKRWSYDYKFVQFLLNNVPKTNLDGLSACEALFGRSLYVSDISVPIKHSSEPFVKSLNSYLNDLHPSLMEFQQSKYDKLLKKDNGNAPSLEKGTRCLIWKPHVLNGKLSKMWAGPYTVFKRLSKDSYILKDNKSKYTFRRNIRHLRPLRTKDGATFQIDPEVETNLESNKNNTFSDEFENLSRFYFDFLPKD